MKSNLEKKIIINSKLLYQNSKQKQLQILKLMEVKSVHMKKSIKIPIILKILIQINLKSMIKK